ncbi:TadE/TadG family type IV pilus assembly protein [Chloroflexota bacterium]
MRLRRQFSGQDIIEFALVLPFLLMLIMGIFDLGRVTFLYSTITNISREGARFGVVNQCDTPGVIAAAKDKAIGIDPDNLDFSISWVPVDCSYPDPSGSGTVTVSVSFDFSPLTPFIANILGGGSSITMDATTTMYLEL